MSDEINRADFYAARTEAIRLSRLAKEAAALLRQAVGTGKWSMVADAQCVVARMTGEAPREMRVRGEPVPDEVPSDE